MKYRLICLAVVAVMLAGVSFVQNYEPKANRYHQHLEERPYTPCTDHTDEVFCTHLPLVLIDTGSQRIPGEIKLAADGSEIVDAFGENIYTLADDGEETIRVQISVVDNPDGNNHLEDSPDFTTDAKFRIRGHASRRFEKSSYLLKFVEEDGTSKDISVMGMGAHSKWVLHGPCLDKSLIRNYICYNWAGEIMEYAPNVRYCEVFLDGEYRGLYLMVETVDNGKDCRLELTREEKGVSTTGYLLCIDRTTESDVDQLWDIYSYMERMFNLREDIQIRYPGKTQLTPELSQDIGQDFARFEKCIYSYDFNSEKYGYQNWIDLDSFVNYFIINELTQNNDAGRYSTYLYKDASEKFKMCVWDFNNAFDNFPDDAMDYESFCMVDRAIYLMLFRDEQFVSEVIKRYQKLRQGILSDENMTAYIDETIAYLGPAVQRNSERWAEKIERWSPLIPLERNVYSQAEAVEQVKRHLNNRSNWMDQNIVVLKQYSSESRNKAYIHE